MNKLKEAACKYVVIDSEEERSQLALLFLWQLSDDMTVAEATGK